MGDTLDRRVSNETSKGKSVINEKEVSNNALAASFSKSHARNKQHLISFGHGSGNRGGAVSHAAIFLVKVAALEAFRRFSRAKCSFAWKGLQALQLFCCPPLKWIKRWAPFKGFVNGIQTLSRPLLVLSIATAFVDQMEVSGSTSNDAGSHDSEANSEQSPVDPTSAGSGDGLREGKASLFYSFHDVVFFTRASDIDLSTSESEPWLIQFHKEMEEQGISLPERINDDELRRFYNAAGNDYACFVSSIKKTIRWRENYRILSREELSTWSNIVFWHGLDVMHRPCLIVRLGLASRRLGSNDKPRFVQAVISQVENGVLHLVNARDSQIMVLVDCEGLSALRFPMQMMRSCSSILQDHFPNRLGCLLVIRLPAVVRVLFQTSLQVLKPATRKKLKVVGGMHHEVLSEYLQTLPACLGGKCTCFKCSSVDHYNMQQLPATRNGTNSGVNVSVEEDEDCGPIFHPQDDMDVLVTCQRTIRTAMISILILWILVAFIAGIYDPETRLYPSP